jgi:thiamine biosynthesis lipoprotein
MDLIKRLKQSRQMPQLKTSRITWKFSAIGTDWSIETLQPVSDTTRAAITEYIESFDRTYSRFRSDSLVWAVRQSSGTYVFPDSAVALFGLYSQLYAITSGKVTPLIGEALDALGYDARYSFIPKDRTPTVPRMNVLQWDGATLTTKQPVAIDVGAIGKGYLIDVIAKMLKKEHDSFTVDGSGDIYTQGVMEEQIGLEDPFHLGRVIGVMSLQNASVCGSATNRRRWGEELHHIVDPDTAQSTNNVAATWVRAESAALADGLATALFFTDPDVLRQTFNFDFICVYDTKRIRYSEGMEGVLI